MVDELLAARGVIVSHETVRQWSLKFGQAFATPDKVALLRHSRRTSATLMTRAVSHWRGQPGNDGQVRGCNRRPRSR